MVSLKDILPFNISNVVNSIISYIIFPIVYCIITLIMQSVYPTNNDSISLNSKGKLYYQSSSFYRSYSFFFSMIFCVLLTLLSLGNSISYLLYTHILPIFKKVDKKIDQTNEISKDIQTKKVETEKKINEIQEIDISVDSQRTNEPDTPNVPAPTQDPPNTPVPLDTPNVPVPTQDPTPNPRPKPVP